MGKKGLSKAGKKQELSEKITKIVRAMNTPTIFTIGARPDGRRDILRIEAAGLDGNQGGGDDGAGAMPEPESLGKRLNYIG